MFQISSLISSPFLKNRLFWISYNLTLKDVHESKMAAIITMNVKNNQLFAFLNHLKFFRSAFTITSYTDKRLPLTKTLHQLGNILQEIPINSIKLVTNDYFHCFHFSHAEVLINSNWKHSVRILNTVFFLCFFKLNSFFQIICLTSTNVYIAWREKKTNNIIFPIKLCSTLINPNIKYSKNETPFFISYRDWFFFSFRFVLYFLSINRKKLSRKKKKKLSNNNNYHNTSLTYMEKCWFFFLFDKKGIYIIAVCAWMPGYLLYYLFSYF
jgi:hypothetical protein